MKVPLTLATWVGLAAVAAARPALAAERPRNGGVIILLQADYRFYLRGDPCDTLVIVAGDDAVADLAERLESEADVAAVRVAATHLDLKLEPVDDAHLTGFSVSEHHAVMVVSETYAAAQRWPSPAARSGACVPTPPASPAIP